MAKSRQPTVVSLFSGAGGLDYGFEAAGFKTSVAIEMDHDSCETLRVSRKWSVIERNIFDVPSDEILQRAKAKAGEVDLVIGGPPCQPFSKAGYWARGDSRRLDDPRANTLSAYLRVVEDLKPKAFLLENVEGLKYAGKDEGLQLLLDEIKRINRVTKSAYKPVVRVLNAASYGVPQLRERVFVIASRDGTEFRFPTPTHGEQQSTQFTFDTVGLEPFRTAWDAIGDLKPDADEELAPRGKWAELLPSIPEGQNYLFHTDRGEGKELFGWRRRYWTFLLKLAKSKPSWTIQAQPGPAVGPFHWQSRRLSVRELCRIQTFPDDVIIQGGRVSQQRQIGNAVPSLLAEVLGRAIRSQLLGTSARGELTLMPPKRPRLPPPEPIAKVPRRFEKHREDRSPHPGTGLGRGALAREASLD